MQQCRKCNLNVTEFFNLRKCNHKICYACLCGYLDNLSSARVRCPIKNCPEIIDDPTIRKCLSNNQLKYYDSLCYGSKTVKCLIKECPYFVAYEEKDGHFVCQICKQPNCVTCGRLHDIDYHCSSISSYDSTEMEAQARIFLKERNRQEFDELNKEYCLMPNPFSFTCSVCLDFILPREGVTLRNCLHSFCETCLQGSIGTVEYIKNMTCLDPNCKTALDSMELQVLINEDKLAKMMIKEASSRFYQCKSEGCTGMWDSANETDVHQCQICFEDNCMACQDIHTGKSCSEFRKTKRYISLSMRSAIPKTTRQIQCFLCKNLLIQDGGCGAIWCDKCGNNTCVFTGKIAGRYDSKIFGNSCYKMDNYCNCTPLNTCHKDCNRGCLPDGH